MTLGYKRVRTVLKNYSYTGAVVCGKYYRIQVGGKHVRKAKESECIVTENVHPAIVTHEEFAGAQVNMREIARADYCLDRGYLLTGKVRCGNCKLALSFSGNPNDAKLFCSHKSVAGAFSMCSEEVYASKMIECAAWETLKKQMEIMCGLSSRLSDEIKALKTVAGSCAAVDKKVECIKAERICQYEAYAEGVITREQYIRI